MSIAGSIKLVSWFGREFKVKASADGERDFGGYKNEYSPNGDGSASQVKRMTCWAIGGLEIDIDDTQGDHEFLYINQQSAIDGDFVITFTSGSSYAGVGNIEGDLSYNSGTGSVTVMFKGPGQLKKL